MSGRMRNGDASAGNHPVTNISAEGAMVTTGRATGVRSGTVPCLSAGLMRRRYETPRTRVAGRAEAHLLRAYYYSELLEMVRRSAAH